MRIVFLGTPIFAVKCLERLIHSNHEVVAVVSQPDKPIGRSNKPVPTPIKKLALEHNVDIVVQLPFIFGTNSADIFSDASIELLHELGVEKTASDEEIKRALKLAKKDWFLGGYRKWN